MEMKQILSELGVTTFIPIEYGSDTDKAGVDAIWCRKGLWETVQIRTRTKDYSDVTIRHESSTGISRDYKMNNVSVFLVIWPSKWKLYNARFFNNIHPTYWNTNKDTHPTTFWIYDPSTLIEYLIDEH